MASNDSTFGRKDSGSDTGDNGWDRESSGAGAGTTAKAPDHRSFSEKHAASERVMQATGDFTDFPELRRNRSDPPQPAQHKDVEIVDSLIVGRNDEEGQDVHGGISEKKMATYDEASPNGKTIRRLSSEDISPPGRVSRRHSEEVNRSSSMDRPPTSTMVRKSSLQPSAFGRPANRKTSMGSYGTNDDMDPDDVDNTIAYWMPPPPSTIHETPSGSELLLETDEDKPLRIDFRCACFKLTSISTVDFTSVLKFVVVFEWNDPRLCGLPITTNDLPGDLWGPDIILENAQNECEVVYDSFSLLSSQTGRLKRTITFHGPVYNPMDLRDFPFDNDELEMKFITICNWRTLDGSRFGNDPVKRVYTLEPMLNRKDGAWRGKRFSYHLFAIHPRYFKSKYQCIYIPLFILTPSVSPSHRLFEQFPFSSLGGAGRLASFQLSDGVKTLSIPPSTIQRNLLRSSLTSIWCARPNTITSKYVSLCLLRC